MYAIEKHLAAQEGHEDVSVLVFFLIPQEMKVHKRLADTARKFRSGQVSLARLEEAYHDCIVDLSEFSDRPGTRQQKRELSKSALAKFGGMEKLIRVGAESGFMEIPEKLIRLGGAGHE